MKRIEGKSLEKLKGKIMHSLANVIELWGNNEQLFARPIMDGGFISASIVEQEVEHSPLFGVNSVTITFELALTRFDDYPTEDDPYWLKRWRCIVGDDVGVFPGDIVPDILVTADELKNYLDICDL